MKGSTFALILFSLQTTNALLHPNCHTSQSTFNVAYSAQLNRGSLIEAYDWGTYLGKGNFGEVHEIRWGGGVAAVKRIDLAWESDEIKRELGYLFSITDVSGAPQMYACLQMTDILGQGKVYLVQEKLYKSFDSGTVLTTFRNMGLKKRIEKYIDLAETLNTLNTVKNFVHADLKPANIMAADSGVSRIKVIDFGLSGNVGEPMIGGTPIFNSPEKINSVSPVNLASDDVWAFVLTIAVIESSIDKIFKGIKDYCFITRFGDGCHTNIVTRVTEVFNQNGFGSLGTELLKGLAYKSTLRAGFKVLIPKMRTAIGMPEFKADYPLPPIIKQDYMKKFIEIDQLGTKDVVELKKEAKQNNLEVDKVEIADQINYGKRDVEILDQYHLLTNKVYEEKNILLKSLKSQILTDPGLRNKETKVNADNLKEVAQQIYQGDAMYANYLEDNAQFKAMEDLKKRAAQNTANTGGNANYGNYLAPPNMTPGQNAAKTLLISSAKTQKAFTYLQGIDFNNPNMILVPKPQLDAKNMQTVLGDYFKDQIGAEVKKLDQQKTNMAGFEAMPFNKSPYPNQDYSKPPQQNKDFDTGYGYTNPPTKQSPPVNRDFNTSPERKPLPNPFMMNPPQQDVKRETNPAMTLKPDGFSNPQAYTNPPALTKKATFTPTYNNPLDNPPQKIQRFNTDRGRTGNIGGEQPINTNPYSPPKNIVRENSPVKTDLGQQISPGVRNKFDNMSPARNNNGQTINSPGQVTYTYQKVDVPTQNKYLPTENTFQKPQMTTYQGYNPNPTNQGYNPNPTNQGYNPNPTNQGKPPVKIVIQGTPGGQYTQQTYNNLGSPSNGYNVGVYPNQNFKQYI